MSYNGWSNWETWNLALWIDNDEPKYRFRLKFLEENGCTEKSVKELCEMLYPNGTPDMGSEYPRASEERYEAGRNDMTKVCYAELAEHWSEE